MWHAHASRENDQAPQDATVQQEHSDAVKEEGHRNSKPMRGGVLRPHEGRNGRMHRGRGDLQVPGTEVGPVRQRLAGGPSECWEGVPSLELARETATERGGGTHECQKCSIG